MIRAWVGLGSAIVALLVGIFVVLVLLLWKPTPQPEIMPPQPDTACVDGGYLDTWQCQNSQ